MRPAHRTCFARMGLTFAASAILVALASSLAFADGVIQGIVKNAASGEPIEYASVQVEGTQKGAMTKSDGTYQIVGLAPGNYTVRVTPLGYKTTSRPVTVVDNVPAKLDIAVEEDIAATLKQIDVFGRDETVDVESSTSEAKIDVKYEFKHRAINTIADALSKEAGVVVQDGQLYVRGGRANETKYFVDGMPVTDPFVGQNSLGVSFSSLSEISLLSGGFDAEFGDAQSGIVNLSTNEGGTKFSGLIKFMTDDFGGPDKTYYNFDNIAFGAGGPLISKDLRLYMSGEGRWSDTYVPLERPRPAREVAGITLRDRQDNEYKGQGKLTYLVGGRSDKKISGEALYSRNESQGYRHHFSRVGYWSEANQQWWFEPLDSTYVFYRAPDHLPDVTSRNTSYKSVWTHSLSPETFYTFKGSYYKTRLDAAVAGQRPVEYDSFDSVVGEDIDPANDYFAVSGDYPRWTDYTTARWTTRGDLTSQVSPSHKMKIGLQGDYYDLKMFDALFPGPDEPTGFFHDLYHVYAWGGSAYIQDRMKHEGMVVNAGLRFDWFDPGIRASRIGNATLASRFIAPEDISFGSRVKTQVSPRLGMAYPITDKDVLHFHYGRFFQLPNLEYLYQYLGQPIDQANSILGNVFLEPENTISYELGVDHQLTEHLTMDMTVFFKDIYGLIGTSTQTQGSNTAVGAQAASSYQNKDYGSVRGLEFKIRRPLTNRVGGSIVYTFSRAAGVSSDVNQGYRIGLGRQNREPIREQPLDWDRSHSIVANLIISDPGVWEVSTDMTYLSGAPFTPETFNQRSVDADLINSRRLPETNRVDVRANKLYKVYGQEFRLFVEGNNVLDRQNINTLARDFWPTNDPLYEVYYTETGQLGGAYSLTAVSASAEQEFVPLGDPTVYQSGRNIRVGILLDW